LAYNRSVISALWLIFAAVACQFSPGTSQSFDENTLETLTAETLAAQEASLPSLTPITSETSTGDQSHPIADTTPTLPEAPATNPLLLFRDDFTQVLGPGWFWIREDPVRWSLQAVPGFLHIILNPAECRGVPTNILLQPVPDGNYQLETQVNFAPVSNFQLAGLIAYQDDDNYLKLGRAFCEGGPGCIGNGVYFDSRSAGEFSPKNFATPTTNPSQINLRLRKEGTSFSAHFSEDGAYWSEVGQHDGPITLQGVGLVAGQSCEDSQTADFNYFSITSLP
jgi:beta-xylosidase